jgi:hypothetical protein
MICRRGRRTTVRAWEPGRCRGARAYGEPLAQGRVKAALDRKERPAPERGKVAQDRKGYPVLLPRLGELRVVVGPGWGKAMSC